VAAVAAQPGLSFGLLLRHLRAKALLTQEELAEAASVSPRSVSDLERGINRTARKDTAFLLANALSLAGPARELFALVTDNLDLGRPDTMEIVFDRQVRHGPQLTCVPVG
jgi:transcriptional regulator with XRE-family HTH domain